MKPIRYYSLILLLLASFSFSSCEKYLDERSAKNLIVPQKLADLQSLLDHHHIMNERYTDLNEIVAGDFYLTSADWSSLSVSERLNYIWDRDAFYNNAWNYPYQPVYYANVVLDELPKMKDAENKALYNDIKGQALFFRSFAFHYLAQLYCRPYSSTASSDQGISLRLTADINIPSGRATVQQTYDQIIADLKEVVQILPETAISPSLPNKAAAYGMLSRVYLSMRDYVNAGKYADTCLSKYSSLLDYNSLNAASANPIPQFNTEVIFWAIAEGFTTISTNSVAKIDLTLVQSYDNNDLRKQVFYQLNSDNVSHGFKGSYGHLVNYAIFNGIATDEMFLTRAECNARAGNKNAALADLNILLVKRWKTGTFNQVTAIDAADALNKILVERRKELVYRGLRWTDIRRLNVEGANIGLSRIINGNTYTLPPNDPRGVMLIPLDVLNLSGMQQNPR